LDYPGDCRRNHVADEDAMNKRQRRDVYLSTRRPAAMLAQRAEDRRIEALPLQERYNLIKATWVGEIPENIKRLALEKGWEK
jgi:hypothetical protein